MNKFTLVIPVVCEHGLQSRKKQDYCVKNVFYVVFLLLLLLIYPKP